MAQIHKCGVCGGEYGNETEYVAHLCPTTGQQPSSIAHLVASTQPDAADIAEAALARGEARK